MNKGIDNIYNKLLNDIEKEIAPKIAEEMKNIEQEVIEEVVYNAYTPIYYERRTSGGLSDKENMKETIVSKENNIEIKVENVTKGNSEYSDAEGYTTGYIDEIIETGQGYGYDLDSYIGARPFTETSQNVIDYTDRIVKLFEEELRKKGW